MATVLVVSTGDGRWQAHLTAAAGPDHELVFTPRWAGVPALLEKRRFGLILLDVRRGERPPYPQLTWLRRQHPHLARLVLLAGQGRGLELFRLGRQGVDEVLLPPGEELSDCLPPGLDRALMRALARRTAARLQGRVPEFFTLAMAWAVEHADADPTPGPAELARAVGLSTDACRRALREADLPAPRRILVWGRLVQAAHALGGPAPPPVDVLAHRLGYAAGPSLARAFRRETGLPPSRVRARGGVIVVHDALLTRVLAGRRPRGD